MSIESMNSSGLPLRYDVEVESGGRIEVHSPLPAGSHVTVFVVEKESIELDDLLKAATSSMDFWENPEDDEDWNNA